MPAVLRVSVAAEQAGIPAVSILASSFVGMGKAFAKGLGLSDPAIAAYPGFPMTDSDTQLRDKVVNDLLPQILSGWSKGRTSDEQATKAAGEPAAGDIVFEGTFDEVQDYFDQRGWSDGLPIVPPTVERIREFLKFTDRSSDEVLGICYPEAREATIWNVAVNGVMAGCCPEYMPVLIAVTEAMVEPRFFLDIAGSTPGWEPLIVINGSIIHDLDFNYGGGVMRVGRRANSSIGRFTRLFMRNIPGQRFPAGGVDKGSRLNAGGTDKTAIGMSFNVVLAENEEALAEIGWPPFSVEHGFQRGENVVTVQSMMSVTQPTFTAGKRAEDHMEIIAESIGQAFKYRAFTGIRDGKMYPLIVMSPSVARVIAEDGWTKDDCKKYLYDHLKMPAGLIEKYARANGLTSFSLKDLVERGRVPREYHESDDPNRLVHALVEPGMIGIVVAGDPGRNQSRGYPQNAKRGVPVSKKIQLPANWRQMLKGRVAQRSE